MTSSRKCLICQEVPGWPKLAWAAVTELGSDTVSVLHGPRVETNPDWCVEAVWAGDYAEGSFDFSDVVVGTGVRVRGNKIVFVSSGDTLNCLHHFQENEMIYVSNSLPALMAIARLELIDHDYAPAMQSINNELVSYVRSIPSTRGPVHLTYFNNLVVSDSKIVECAKPPSAPDFKDFATYRDYLTASAQRVGENARASDRRHAIRLLATVSSGYNSDRNGSLGSRGGGTRIRNDRTGASCSKADVRSQQFRSGGGPPIGHGVRNLFTR